MTEDEVMAFYKELQEFYGDRLANFEHHPRIFASQVRLYRYYKGKQNEDRNM